MSKYTNVHVSFQSTSLSKLSTVNTLNECKLTVHKRTRGCNENKCTWDIEINAACKIYLGTYSRIDSIDHLIKNCCMKYWWWKYWHLPMLHATSLAIVVAYDIYLIITEGKLDEDWRVSSPVDFWTFGDVLSIQMLEYDSLKRKHINNDAMHASMHAQNKKGKIEWPMMMMLFEVDQNGEVDQQLHCRKTKSFKILTKPAMGPVVIPQLIK